MKWKEYTIHTTVDAEDLVAMTLMELGVEGVEIEDNIPPTESELEAMFIDLQPELEPELQAPDGSARLKFFLHEPEDETAADMRRTEREAVAEAGGTAETELEVKAEAETEAGSNMKISGVAAEVCQNSETPEDDMQSARDDSYVIADRIWLPEEIEALMEAIRENLDALRDYVDVGEGRIEIRETQDTDWRDNWKQFYKPVFMDDLLICPEWEEIPEAYGAAVGEGTVKVIRIEPGTAFGTGTHESTKLCIDGLKRFVKGGETLLDIGTGSGILGLCALSMGASKVFATELDPACEEVLEKNLSLNGIGKDRFELRMGDILTDRNLQDAAWKAAQEGSGEKPASRGFDLVIANILAPVIIALAAPGQADRFVRPGGVFITSGIIDTKEQEVCEAFAENPAWETIEVVHMNEWISVVARKNGSA